MKVTSSAVSLTVENVSASSQFLVDHLGYHQDMAADGFAALPRHDAAINIVFLRRGLEVMPLEFRDQHACGVIVALIVEDLDAELSRLVDEGVEITIAAARGGMGRASLPDHRPERHRPSISAVDMIWCSGPDPVDLTGAMDLTWCSSLTGSAPEHSDRIY